LGILPLGLLFKEFSMTQDEAELIFQHNPERPFRQYLKGIVIEPGLALNESAASFFQTLDGKTTVRAGAAKVAASYDTTPEACLADCLELARELEKERIITRVEQH
jgi:hypothetical protein